MGELVREWQASFIRDKQTTDNIVITQEVLHSLRKKKKRKGEMIAQIDLEKAYDQINWEFLEEVLKKVGFGTGFWRVIMNCIKSTSLVVI